MGWLSLKRCVEILIPVTVNTTLFKSLVIEDVSKLSWGHIELGWALIQFELCPYKKSHRHTHTHTQATSHDKKKTFRGDATPFLFLSSISNLYIEKYPGIMMAVT